MDVAMQIQHIVGVNAQLHDFDAQRLQFIDWFHLSQYFACRLANAFDIALGIVTEALAHALGDGITQA